MKWPWSKNVETKLVEPITLPRRGERWVLKPNSGSGDPFPAVEYGCFVRVLEVRAGWVRYYMGNIFPDNRATVESFLRMYERVLA